MKPSDVQKHLNDLYNHSVISANKKWALEDKVRDSKKDSDKLKKLYDSLPKITQEDRIFAQAKRTADNTKLIANIMIFYLVCSLIVAFYFMSI